MPRLALVLLFNPNSIEMARKLPKKPKKPRQSASLTAWQNYEKRYKDWEKKVKEIESDKKKKAQLINKLK